MISIQRIFKDKNSIYLKYQSGDICVIKKLPFKSYIFIPNNKGNYYNFLNNKNYKSIEVDNKDKFYNYRDSFPDALIYDNLFYYLHKLYWQGGSNKEKYSISNNLHIWYLDIEVMSEKEFPKPEEAKYPITMIQVFDNIKKEFYLFINKEKEEGIIDRFKKYKGYNVHIFYGNELDIYLYFFKLLNRINPTIITAWNGWGFDFPYILNRIKNNYSNYLDKFKVLNSIDFSKRENSISGIVLFDMLELYKKFTYKNLPSFSLKYVTNLELSSEDAKIEYDEYDNIFEFYKKNYERFIEYALMDVYTLWKLDEKLLLFNLIFNLSIKYGIDIVNITGTLYPWEMYIRHIAFEKRLIFHKVSKSISKVIKGGYVNLKKDGLEEYLFTIDFNSWYPSIINSFNISPDTYIKDNNKYLIMDEDEEKLLNNNNLMKDIGRYTKENNIIYAGQGYFRKDKKGIIPSIISNIYNERKNEKRKLLIAKSLVEEIRLNKGDKLIKEDNIISLIEVGSITLDNTSLYRVNDIDRAVNILNDYIKKKHIIQLALKIMMNSLYGAFGNKHFIFFEENMASSITFIGRFIIRYTANELEKYLQRIFNIDGDLRYYIDTDSASFKIKPFIDKYFKKIGKNNYNDLTNEEKHKFIGIIIKFIEKYIYPKLDEIVDSVCNVFNIYEKGFMGVKVEKIIERALYLQKKKYIYKIIYNEGSYIYNPKLTLTGIEIVRSSTSTFTKEYLMELLEMIMNDVNVDQIISFIDKVKKDFFKRGYKDIAKVSSISDLNYKIYKGRYVRCDNEGNLVLNKNNNPIPLPQAIKGAVYYNEFIDKEKINTKKITSGDKVYMLYLTNGDIMSFLDEEVLIRYLKKTGLKIDYFMNFDRYFLSPVKLVLDVLDIDIEKKERGLF